MDDAGSGGGTVPPRGIIEGDALESELMDADQSTGAPPSQPRPSASPSPRHAALAVASLPRSHFVGKVRGLLIFLELCVDHDDVGGKGAGYVHHGTGVNAFGDFRVTGLWRARTQQFVFENMAHDTKHFQSVKLNTKWKPASSKNGPADRAPDTTAAAEPRLDETPVAAATLLTEGAEDYDELERDEADWEREHSEYLGTLEGTSDASSFGLGHEEEAAVIRQVKGSEVIADAKARLMGERRHFWLAAVKENGFALRKAPDSVKGDRAIVLEAIDQTPQALEHASPVLRADKEVVLAAVRTNGHTLKFALDPIPGDEDVVLAAVEQSGYALRYASEALRARHDTVLAALASDGSALLYASRELRADKAVIHAACGTDVSALRFASPAIQSDPEFLGVSWLAELKRDWRAYERVPFEVRNNKDFALRSAPFLKAARLERAQQYREDLSVGLQHDYHEHEDGQLNAALTDGTTALVRSEYIVDLARRCRQQRSDDPSLADDERLGRFTPRSSTPPEAFYPGPIYENARIIAYSYQWATADDPDADGTQLQDLAVFLEYLHGCEDTKGVTFLLFIDTMSLFAGTSAYRSASLWFVHPRCFTLHNRRTPSQRWAPSVSASPLVQRVTPTKMFPPAGDDVVVVGSPFSPKSPKKSPVDREFVIGSPVRGADDGKLPLPHSSPAPSGTRVLISRTPGRGTGTGKVSYLDNGWAYFQYTVSNMKKALDMILDLGSARDWLEDETVGTAERTFAALVAACQEKRSGLVEAPPSVEAALVTKHVFDAADRAFLARKYEETFDAVLGAASTLNLQNIRVDNDEWDCFVRETLPRCLSLRILDLSNNPELGVAASLIAAMCPPKLGYLHLHNTSVHGHITDFVECSSLEHLVVTETRVEGTSEELVAQAPARFYVRTDISQFEV